MLPQWARSSRVLPLLCLVSALAARTAVAGLPGETKDQIDKRMAWWREAKFGMLIHLGLYSIPAGEWKGKKAPGLGEWIMKEAGIPKDEYAQLHEQFNPVKFDARRIVGTAKGAGMKYITITAKHHDGFCLFDSRYTDFDVMSTPYRRDVLKELSEECRRQGIRFTAYFSILDWYHADYLPRRPVDTRPTEGADFERYIGYMQNQLREILSNYGPVGVMWFDGEWDTTWTDERGVDLYRYVRSLQPDIIINNRVGRERDRLRDKRGRPKLLDEFGGDFTTPENRIGEFDTDVPWETCETINDTWGFRRDDHNWKSTQVLIRMLVETVSKGGNFMLNVGPTPEGLIPQPCVERLAQIGTWLEGNGESIYGATASPLEPLAWGCCTMKPGTLYLHVFNWPADGRLIVPGLPNKIQKAYLLADAEQAALSVTRAGGDLALKLPAKAPHPVDTVVVLQIEGDIGQEDER